MISQLGDALLPVVFLIVAWAVAFVALSFRHKSRAFRHAERMAALDKGMELPPEPVQPTLGPKAHLLRGLIWLFIGMGISIFFLSLRLATKENNELFAVATLGLIPMGVGIAHLVMYRLDTRAAPPAGVTGR
ncbi:MAG TPA: DUF6249 domain-containing protein [Bryobacteraceae bacterium]|nr:DUF6249 domain-containing protein [Bryobacteraceae bacterium]